MSALRVGFLSSRTTRALALTHGNFVTAWQSRRKKGPQSFAKNGASLREEMDHYLSQNSVCVIERSVCKCCRGDVEALGRRRRWKWSEALGFIAAFHSDFPSHSRLSRETFQIFPAQRGRLLLPMVFQIRRCWRFSLPIEVMEAVLTMRFLNAPVDCIGIEPLSIHWDEHTERSNGSETHLNTVDTWWIVNNIDAKWTTIEKYD